jgi:hypothetical protein
MSEQSDQPFMFQDANGRRYSLIMLEAPAPPRRGGCLTFFIIALILLVLFFGWPSFAQSFSNTLPPTTMQLVSNDGGLPPTTMQVRTAEALPPTTMQPLAPEQPLTDVFVLDPFEQGRSLIYALEQARNAAMWGEFAYFEQVAVGQFLNAERDLARRYQASQLREQWVLQNVQVRMIDLESAQASMCTSELWSVAFVDANGVAGVPTQHTVHAWYKLDRGGPTLLISEMFELVAPCGV